MDGLDLAGMAHRSIPFGLHGDEVPITGVGKVWAKSALTFQCFSLLAASAGLGAKQCMLWVWSVFEKLCTEGAEVVQLETAKQSCPALEVVASEVVAEKL